MAKSMSGSGGFYKYRCKYFYTKSCQNWVYVNGEACVSCLAEGCDAEGAGLERPYSPNVCVPFVQDGIFRYTMVGKSGFGLHPFSRPEGARDIEPPQGPLRRMPFRREQFSLFVKKRGKIETQRRMPA
ncbi:hypothetical protein VUR80DRAFT_6249 [Thermomyces stellatus]